MGKPVVGDIVVVDMPQTDLMPGKRRPALVVFNSSGEDVVLCQITSQAHRKGRVVSVTAADLASGHLHTDSFVRPERLFTVDYHLIHYTVAKLSEAKLNEVRQSLREMFAD